jgi:hypothetical protein
LPLDALQFDLSALQRGVDEFFTRLAELGLPGGGGVTFPLVSAVIVVAALAYDCGRCWGRRRVVSATSSEDFVADLSVEEP